MPTGPELQSGGRRSPGCLLLFIGGFLLIWAGIASGMLINFLFLGSQVSHTEWVIDQDINHPGYAKAMPTVNGVGSSEQSLILKLDKPFRMPVGCVKSNDTSGQFTPLCNPQ